jgi:uncharacterized protein YndB with AHSA1/START domain
MTMSVAEQTVQMLEILKEEEIAAPMDIVFETILEQMGPYNQKPDGTNMQMKLEAWPGGRWFRDLGKDSGHLWGHVQAIKAPTLLEICGPLFMSTPAVSNLQYRLTEERGVTKVQFSHRMAGWLPDNVRDGVGVNTGWTYLMSRIREEAERRSGKS